MQVMLALTKLYLFSKNSGNRSRDFFYFPVISNIEKFTLPYARCSEKLGWDEKS